MNMLIETLQQAGSNPWSWAIVGLIAAIAMINLYRWRTCPYLHHKRRITATESAQSLDRPFIAGPRFILVMLIGIGVILSGLTMMSREANPPLALLLIILGVFAVQTEPALLQIREAVKRLVASQIQGVDATTAAEDRLRDAHMWLVTTSFAILAAVVMALLAF